MEKLLFGELHRKLREECSISLRKYCILSKQDPGNVSRMERGVIPPPQSQETLRKMAKTLGVEEGSESWQEFFDAAALSAGRLPRDVCEDERLLRRLPVLLRTLTGQKLCDEKMDELVEIIRRG